MEGIKKYFKYHSWATKRLVDYLKPLDENLLEKEVKSSFPSIKLTLIHMAWAENIWLNRLDGVELKAYKEWSALPTQMLFEEYIRYCKMTTDFLGHADLAKKIKYSNTSGEEFSQTIEEIGIHLINHASYHIGQIVTMLRQHNLDKIPAFDFIAYGRT